MDRLPIIYVRGYAGPTTGIDAQVDDPFYGFNAGATHVRVGGDGEPMFYQFEGPLLRLMTDEGYRLLVHGDQTAYLQDAAAKSVPATSMWIYRYYDQAATTFGAPEQRHLFDWAHKRVTSDGFDIETAAEGLYKLILLVCEKTGADKVFLVAHSMGGLVARCMIQKVCESDDHRRARDIVAKVFTYGTPWRGIAFGPGILDWIEKNVGPAGSEIFSPPKMYGYLTPGRKFGDEPPLGENWDPGRIDPDVFAASDIFCLIGTDPQDYGIPRIAVGPKSDGLVRIENAYVSGAHRAYVHKSHSGRYGEVNSEEGYQNLRRFLFGRWAVTVSLDGLTPYPQDMAALEPDEQWPVWQADMRLAIRGIPVVMSEQLAAHWCPIQINDELRRHVSTPDTPVPLVSSFLIDPGHERELAVQRGDTAFVTHHQGRMRHTLTLRVYKLAETVGAFRFGEHLEQVPDWADTLIIDVGPDTDGTGMHAWVAWVSEVHGANDEFDPITSQALTLTPVPGGLSGRVQLPTAARALAVIGPNASLGLQVRDRD